MVTQVEWIPKTGRFRVTFDLGRFQTAERKVVVAGTFNDWSTRHEEPALGFFHRAAGSNRAVVELPPGYYEYKYYDVTRQAWLEIEAEPEIYRYGGENFCGNPFGTKNCRLRLG